MSFRFPGGGGGVAAHGHTRIPDMGLPVIFSVANVDEQIASIGSGIYAGKDHGAKVPSNERLFSFVAGEVAFQVNRPKPKAEVDEHGRVINPDRSDIQVQTSLNGLEVSNGAMQKAVALAEKLNMQGKDKEEFIRAAIAAHLTAFGVVQTNKEDVSNNRGFTGFSKLGPAASLRIFGTCSMPVVIGEGVRAGAVVEAVPVTPGEFSKICNSSYAHGFAFVPGKAQMLIREIRQTTVVRSLAYDTSLFMQYHDQVMAAYGAGDIPMELMGSISAVWRSFLYAGLQMLGLLCEEKIIKEIAGIPLSNTGRSQAREAIPKIVNGKLNPVWSFVAGIMMRDNGRRITTNIDVGDWLIVPRPDVQEICSILSVLLGMNPAAGSSYSAFDAHTKNIMMDPTHKNEFLKLQKKLQRRLFWDNTTGSDQSHIHGIKSKGNDPQLRTYSALVSRRDQIGQYTRDDRTSAGKFLAMQQMQPDYLYQAVLGMASAKMRNKIGHSVGSTSCSRGVNPGADIFINGFQYLAV